MAKFNKNDGLTYEEFFANYRTEGVDINNIRDSDDCTKLIRNYNNKKPPNGLFERYWSNGNVRYKWYYKNGKQEGASNAWYPNGDLKNLQHYRKGLRHGMLIGFFENGHVSGIRHFNNGKKTGIWTDFWPIGQKWCEKKFNNDKLIYEKFWNEDGSIGTKNCHSKGEVKLFRRINPNYPNQKK